MNHQHPGAPGWHEPEDEALSPALSALDARLRQDGAQWRATAPDPADWLPDLSRCAHATARGATQAPGHAPTLAERRLDLPSAARETRGAPHHPGRLGAVLGGGSALLIVALLALVLHGFAGNRGATSGHQASGTATPHTLQPASAWTTTALTGHPDGLLVAAPSNPEVMYSAGVTNLTLRRSRDGGKTWQAATVPTQDTAEDPADSSIGGINISPSDPETIFLTISSSASNPKCPRSVLGRVGGNMNASGGYSCTFDYVSHDGGATWAKPSLPDSGRLEPGFFTVGSRLVALLDHDVNGQVTTQGFRLIASDDGGNTWAYIDQNLWAQGRVIAQYLPDTGDMGAWAITEPPQITINDSGTQLWRTDDGTTWRQVPAPSQCFAKVGCMLTASRPGSPSTLYLALITAVASPNQPSQPMMVPQVFVAQYYLTSDLGQTWTPLPTAGIPNGLGAQLYGFGGMGGATVLGDGTVLAIFSHQTVNVASAGPHSSYSWKTTNNASYYMWRPGTTAWVQMTPTLPANTAPMQSWLLPRSGGGYTLWVLANTVSGTAPTQTFTWALSSATLG